MTDEGDLTVLDVDVCTRHGYATDLAILLVHPIWDLGRQEPAASQPFVDTALGSCTAAFPLDAGHLAHTPLLMRYRMAAIRTWALSGRAGGGHPDQVDPTGGTQEFHRET